MTLEIGEVSWARARRDLRLSAPNRPGNLCVARDIERSDQLLREEPAGRWLSSWLSPLDRFSKNGVGRTGFEPVTSSVSGNSGVSVTVGLSRAGSP